MQSGAHTPPAADSNQFRSPSRGQAFCCPGQSSPYRCVGTSLHDAGCADVLFFRGEVEHCNILMTLPYYTAKEKIKLFTPKFYNNTNTHLSKIGASCLARAVFARSKLSCPTLPGYMRLQTALQVLQVRTRRVRSHRVHRGPQRKRCVGATPAKCGHLMATTCVTNGHGPTHHPPFPEPGPRHP